MQKELKTVEQFDVKNKKVILSSDLNVTIKDGKIKSTKKIEEARATIQYLMEQKAKITIFSHFGRVKTEEDKKELSLKPICDELSKQLNQKVKFCPVTRGEELETMINSLEPGEVMMMENTRFEDVPDKKESSCDDELSKYWSSLADIAIIDALGKTHRRHASNTGIAKYLPYGVGFTIQKEIEGLKPLLNPEHPFVVVMSGSKVSDKIELISNILPKCDYLLLGGGIANTFLSLKHNMGKSLVSPESLDEVSDLIIKYADKIIMPVDGINQNEEIKDISALNDEDIIYDIGPATIEHYKKYIDLAKLVFVNGTVGMYEDTRFATGTKAILETCAKAPAHVIVGGGDALASVEASGITEGIDFISTGGGATLDLIGKGEFACFKEDHGNSLKP